MAIQIPEKLQKAFEDLKENYRPRFGEILFFDLTKEYYSIYWFKDDDELEGSGLIDEFWKNKPYAVIGYLKSIKAMQLTFYGVSFIKEYNLDIKKTICFQGLRTEPIDMEKVKLELQELFSLLSDPEAS